MALASGPGPKLQAASLKLQAPSSKLDKRFIMISRKLKEKEMKTSEVLKLQAARCLPSKMPGNNWFTCQRMQDWRQAPEGPRLCLVTVMLKGCYVLRLQTHARRLQPSRDRTGSSDGTPDQQPPDVFRWHDSGDVQDRILNKFMLSAGYPKRHWLLTREAWIKDHLTDKPDNLVIRFKQW